MNNQKVPLDTIVFSLSHFPFLWHGSTEGVIYLWILNSIILRYLQNSSASVTIAFLLLSSVHFHLVYQTTFCPFDCDLLRDYKTLRNRHAE